MIDNGSSARRAYRKNEMIFFRIKLTYFRKFGAIFAKNPLSIINNVRSTAKSVNGMTDTALAGQIFSTHGLSSIILIMNVNRGRSGSLREAMKLSER